MTYPNKTISMIFFVACVICCVFAYADVLLHDLLFLIYFLILAIGLLALGLGYWGLEE